MTNRLLEKINEAEYYKRLYANAQATVDVIYMKTQSELSDAIKLLDIQEAVKKEYKLQQKIGAR